MQLIGICGRKGSGKSTLGKIIAEHALSQHRPVFFVPFAKFLKDMLAAAGLPMEWFTDPAHKEQVKSLLQGKTPRHAMITLGTEWGRDMIGQEFWVGLWRHYVVDIDANHSWKSVVICDDVRFPQELQAIRDLDGFAVGICRNEYAAEFRPPLPQPLRWWKERNIHLSERMNFFEHGVRAVVNNGHNGPDADELWKQFCYLHDSYRGS